MSKFLLISTPRTAGTFYCKHLSEQFGLINCGEPFGERSLGGNKATKQRFTQGCRTFFGPQPAMVKIHPVHMLENKELRPKNFYNELVANSTDIRMLVRRDTEAQLKSLFVASYVYQRRLGSWHDNWRDTLWIPDTPEVQKLWRSVELYLYGEIQAQATLYSTRTVPMEVVWTEDLPQENKYVRPVHLDFDIPLTHKADFKGLFSE